jgi:hypothetical protein
MADDRKTQDRPVLRSFERHRLEEQLWSLAFHHVWSVIRKKPKASGANTNHRPNKPSRATAQKARRA